jgi:hypothetical protein
MFLRNFLWMEGLVSWSYTKTLVKNGSARTGVGTAESMQIWGLRRPSFILLDREIGIPTAEYGR